MKQKRRIVGLLVFVVVVVVVALLMNAFFVSMLGRGYLDTSWETIGLLFIVGLIGLVLFPLLLAGGNNNEE